MEVMVCVCVFRFEQLVQLVTMIGDKGELPIAMALASVVTTNQMVSVDGEVSLAVIRRETELCQVISLNWPSAEDLMVTVPI